MKRLKEVKIVREENEIRNDVGLSDLVIRFIHYACNELEIKDQIIVMGCTKMNVQALIYLNSMKLPMILINTEKVRNVYVALAHELTHLKQSIDGRWDLGKGTTIVGRYGDQYVSTLAEEIEREALSTQYIIYKSFKKNERFIRINRKRLKG